MLEAVESHRIQMPMNSDNNMMEDLSEDANKIEDIISETLAKIHQQQGYKKAAIKMYERLIEVNEDKADVFLNKIDELKKKLDLHKWIVFLLMKNSSCRPMSRINYNLIR